MNYIKPEQIKAYVNQNPTGIGDMSEELAAMVNHFAELIVKECAELCLKHAKYHGLFQQMEFRKGQHFNTIIKNHLELKNDKR